MATIRDIKLSDLPVVVGIIAAHNQADGRIAEKYYRTYFEYVKTNGGLTTITYC